MKFNFKKISAIASSVLLTSMTMGVAAAYPDTFVSGGSANVAIVYGTGVGVSDSDQVQANKIEADLLEGVTSTDVVSVSGGESLALGGEDDEFYFGGNLSSVYDDPLDDNDMEDFLADGEYDDGDIDEEYSQTITLSSQALELFTDTNYEDKTPTLGFHFDNDNVLSYTITMDSAIDYSDMQGTDLPLMGNTYYVLDATDEDELILLDSAEKNIISEGETMTVDGKTVEITYITDEEVKFTVDGETTDKLFEDAADGDKYYELDDESYIVLSDNLYEPKETGISKAEFSIGSGKVTLFADGSEIEVNDDTVDGLSAEFDSASDDLTYITVTWETDGDEFLVEGTTIAMPVFETISLAYNGLDFPADSEAISIENGETLVLSMGNYDIDLLYENDTDGQTVELGGEDHPLILDTTPDSSKTYYVVEDDRILASFINEDLSDAETAYYEVVSMDNSSNGYDLKLDDLTGEDNDVEFTDADADDDEDMTSDISVALNAVWDTGELAPELVGTDGEDYLNASNYTDYGVAKITVSHDDSDDLDFDKVVSDLGMVVLLPEAGNLSDDDLVVTFYEADEDGDVDEALAGTGIEVSLAWEDDDDYIYATKDGVNFEEESDDNFYGYAVSPLATKVMVDTNDDSWEAEYYGEKVTADVQVIGGGAISTSTSSAGGLVVTDDNVDSVSSKNLIIVGGSCINSAAATALGVAENTCGAAFTDATGVGTGQFLLKAVDGAFSSGKVALVVAGYETADTVAATTYLMTKDVDASSVDEVYTSSTMEAVMA